MWTGSCLQSAAQANTEHEQRRSLEMYVAAINRVSHISLHSCLAAVLADMIQCVDSCHVL